MGFKVGDVIEYIGPAGGKGALWRLIKVTPDGEPENGIYLGLGADGGAHLPIGCEANIVQTLSSWQQADDFAQWVKEVRQAHGLEE